MTSSHKHTLSCQTLFRINVADASRMVMTITSRRRVPVLENPACGGSTFFAALTNLGSRRRGGLSGEDAFAPGRDPAFTRWPFLFITSTQQIEFYIEQLRERSKRVFDRPDPAHGRINP